MKPKDNDSNESLGFKAKGKKETRRPSGKEREKKKPGNKPGYNKGEK